MSGELFTAMASGASILGAILGVVAWIVSRSTNRLIRAVHAEGQAARERIHAETLAVLERIDQRADQRHRDLLGE